MRPTSRAACPNCGKELELPASATKFVCKYCGEALRIAPDKRLFLLTPIARYSQLGGIAKDSNATPPTRAEMLNRGEEHRKLVSAEMAFERIERQKKEALRFSRIGAGLFAVGILFLLVVLARSALVGLVFADVIIPALSILCLISFGTYFMIWSVFIQRSSREEEEELRKELFFLKGKAANDP